MSALNDMESAHPGWIVATEFDQKEDDGGHILSNMFNYASSPSISSLMAMTEHIRTEDYFRQMI